LRSTLVDHRGAYLAWDAVSVTIAFVFTSVAMLNVSLLWIEIADRTSKGRVAAISNVTKYRTGLYVYYPFVSITIPVLVILEESTYAVAAALPAFLFIFVTYVYGGFKIRKLLNTSDSPSSKKSLRDISVAAFGIGGSGTVTLLVTIIIVTEIIPAPDVPLVDNGNLLTSWLFVVGTVTDIFVVNYCKQYIHRAPPKTTTSAGDGTFKKKETSAVGVLAVKLEEGAIPNASVGVNIGT
jgi:hypothetical protein